MSMTVQARWRQRLKQDATGAGKRRQKQAFAARQAVPQAWQRRDFVGDAFFQSHKGARIDAHGLSGFERAFDNRASDVHEQRSRSRSALQDEVFAVQKVAETSRKRGFVRDVSGRA